MPRLFVASWPPGPVLAALRGIERPAQAGLRFTTEDQWHVTLCFLGEVGEESVPGVVVALEALRSCPAAEAELWPAPRRLGPTTVVLDVAGLDDIAGAVGSAVGRVGRFGGDDRRYHGHITLARMRQPARWPSGGVGGLAAPLRWQVTELALVRSHLGGGPARYETVAKVSLGDA